MKDGFSQNFNKSIRHIQIEGRDHQMAVDFINSYRSDLLKTFECSFNHQGYWK